MSVDRILFEMEKRALKKENERIKNHPGDKILSYFEGVFAVIFTFLLILAIVGVAYFSISNTNIIVNVFTVFLKVYENVSSVISPVPAAIVFGTISLPLGYIFFKIREKTRILYGYLEIGFGIFSAILTVGDKNQWSPVGNVGNTNLITYGVFFASIYIIVRGFDNLQTGRKQIKACQDLLDSSEQNQIDTVKYLLESGVDVNCKFRDGITPLMLAVDKENVEVVKILLNKGADKDSKNLEGKTALMLAKEKNNTELIDLLSDKPDSN